MKKKKPYQSKEPNAQGLFPYSTEEDSVWAELIKRQCDIVQTHGCPDFLEGLKKLNLPKDRVPQVKEIGERLTELTQWNTEPVPALIPIEKFFHLIANKKFPVTTFIRRQEEIDYLEEPDIFHEAFGHCPLLTNEEFAAFSEKLGQIALEADKNMFKYLQRLYWLTVEFGLMQTENGPRVYGAGIISSKGETIYSVESTKPERRAFNLVDIFRTPYRIDIYQPIYYVIEDFGQIYHVVSNGWKEAVQKAAELGDFEPTFPIVHENGTPVEIL